MSSLPVQKLLRRNLTLTSHGISEHYFGTMRPASSRLLITVDIHYLDHLCLLGIIARMPP